MDFLQDSDAHRKQATGMKFPVQSPLRTSFLHAEIFSSLSQKITPPSSYLALGRNNRGTELPFVRTRGVRPRLRGCRRAARVGFFFFFCRHALSKAARLTELSLQEAREPTRTRVAQNRPLERLRSKEEAGGTTRALEETESLPLFLFSLPPAPPLHIHAPFRLTSSRFTPKPRGNESKQPHGRSHGGARSSAAGREGLALASPAFCTPPLLALKRRSEVPRPRLPAEIHDAPWPGPIRAERRTGGFWFPRTT